MSRLSALYLLALVAGILLLCGWEPAPLALCFDDAYYYFQIARHLANGDGSTFDGINFTNGYHPLWMALCTAAFALKADPDRTVRGLLCLQLLFYLAALRQIRPSGLAASLVLLAGIGPAVAQTAINGLESALVAVIHAAILGRMGKGRLTWLLPLAFLARTDAVFLVGALVWVDVVTLIRPSATFSLGQGRRGNCSEPRSGERAEIPPSPRPCPGERTVAERQVRGRFGQLNRILDYVPIVLTILLYLALNQHFFGTPLQISGTIKRLPLTLPHVFGFIVFPLVPSLLLLFCPPTSAFSHTHRFFLRTAPYAIFCGTLLGYYLFLQDFPQLWYFLPPTLYALALFGHFLEDLEERALREGTASWKLGMVVLLPLFLAFGMEAGRLTDPHTRAAAESDRRMAEAVTHLLKAEPAAVLGSWDAGVIGFYAARPVINLDGLVNSAAFYQAAKAGKAGEMLRDQGLGYLINHDTLVEGQPESLGGTAERLLGPVGLQEKSREEFLYAGGSNRAKHGLHPMATLLYQISWTTDPPNGPPQPPTSP